MKNTLYILTALFLFSTNAIANNWTGIFGLRGDSKTLDQFSLLYKISQVENFEFLLGGEFYTPLFVNELRLNQTLRTQLLPTISTEFKFSLGYAENIQSKGKGATGEVAGGIRFSFIPKPVHKNSITQDATIAFGVLVHHSSVQSNSVQPYFNFGLLF